MPETKISQEDFIRENRLYFIKDNSIITRGFDIELSGPVDTEQVKISPAYICHGHDVLELDSDQFLEQIRIKPDDMDSGKNIGLLIEGLSGKATITLKRPRPFGNVTAAVARFSDLTGASICEDFVNSLLGVRIFGVSGNASLDIKSTDGLGNYTEKSYEYKDMEGSNTLRIWCDLKGAYLSPFIKKGRCEYADDDGKTHAIHYKDGREVKRVTITTDADSTPDAAYSGVFVKTIRKNTANTKGHGNEQHSKT